jgi:hypothetical protein
LLLFRGSWIMIYVASILRLNWLPNWRLRHTFRIVLVYRCSYGQVILWLFSSTSSITNSESQAYSN